MFSQIELSPPDPLYAAAAAFAADTRSDKIDLSVGVYRDEDGASPVMEVVKAAEAKLLREQATKAYRPLMGDPVFLAEMTRLALGDDHPAVAAGRVVAIQATGGTGALRLAAALARSASTTSVCHIGMPSWPSHPGVFGGEGLSIKAHDYWHAGSETPDWEAIQAAAAGAGAGDIFLMHGPCHNPTGIDLTMEQRASLLEELARNEAVPLMDIAYYGLGDGLEADLSIIRQMVAAVPRGIIAMSCSKAFGLYRERTGILFVLCADAGEAERVRGQIGILSRLLVSSAPAHGAEAVAHILHDAALNAAWRTELEEMRQRILTLRTRLSDSGLPAFRDIVGQKGIFAMLPLSPDDVATLARDHAIYMPPSGRANLVGLRDVDVDRFTAAIALVKAAEPVAS
ncbi:aromatic amino acid transaminase [Sphingobium sp.]|uniref:aromatic amino acid transaminase n=1 Tax=Sphingobium sp. TaxID=1912891 RepID=UPI00260328DF|nr:aromatic amino acid transaminase [Sphingobium sp.]